MPLPPPDFLPGLPAPDGACRRLVSSLIAGRAPVAVALSGGADSTAALLWAVARFSAGRVLALHYHHNLRGASADLDLEHARAVALGLGVKFFDEKRSEGGRTDEASLRDDRQDFFMRVLRRAGAVALIQGHHADDVAESLLMRVARGAGAAGLCVPRPVSKLPDGTPILRPLLSLRKRDIEFALRAAEQDWRTDASNSDPNFATRNRIRASVAPLWEAALPGNPVEGASRSRMLLQEDDDALRAWTDRLLRAGLEESRRFGTLLRLPEGGVPRAVLRRLIHALALRVVPGVSLSSAAVDAFLEEVEEGRTPAFSLGPDSVLRFRDGVISVHLRQAPLPRRDCAVLPLPGAVFWPDGASLTAIVSDSPGEADNLTRVFLNPPSARVLFCSTVSPSDRYRPLGAPGSQKVRDAMVNRKVPREFRDSLPAVADSLGVLWCPGLLPAERARFSDTELRPLRLTWNPPSAGWPTLPVT